METLQQIIDDINKILSSKKSKLGIKDRDTLIIIREKLKRKRSKSALIAILKDLFKIIATTALIYKDTS